MGKKTNREESFDQEQFDREFFGEVEEDDTGLFSGRSDDDFEDEDEEVEEEDESKKSTEEPDAEEGNEGEEYEEDILGDDEEPDDEELEQDEEDEEEDSKKDEASPKKGATESDPLVTLVHQGREIPIRSKEDLAILAQQGLDYTAKTQALSPWRSLIQYLNSNPEVLQDIQARMEGKEPQKEDKEEKTALPEQREDETYEEYVARVARESAKQEYESRQKSESRKSDQIARTVSNVQKDPLFRPVVQLMTEDLKNGRLSQEEYQRANKDPNAFAELYTRYRTTADVLIRNSQKKKKEPGVPEPTDKKTPVKKKTRKTFTEKSRRKKATPSSKEITDRAIEEMDNESLEQLIERVKGGEKI